MQHILQALQMLADQLSIYMSKTASNAAQTEQATLMSCPHGTVIHKHSTLSPAAFMDVMLTFKTKLAAAQDQTNKS